MEGRNALGGGDVRFERRGGKGVIKSYEDLDVYNNSYKAMLMVFKYVLPRLPKEERFDLVDQLRRSCKAVPRLIAEGYSKRHQARGFQKYLNDAHAESNETIVSLTQVKDLYNKNIDVEKIIRLIDLYDKVSRQLFNLSRSWKTLISKR